MLLNIYIYPFKIFVQGQKNMESQKRYLSFAEEKERHGVKKVCSHTQFKRSAFLVYRAETRNQEYAFRFCIFENAARIAIDNNAIHTHPDICIPTFQ